MLLTEDEARHAVELDHAYVIYPEYAYWREEEVGDRDGDPLPDGFRYSSDRNDWQLDADQLSAIIEDVKIPA